MVRQCAWCNRVLGHVPPLEDDAVTHSVCPECYEQIFAGEDGLQSSDCAAEDSPASSLMTAKAIA
jgi:hypothetical protein